MQISYPLDQHPMDDINIHKQNKKTNGPHGQSKDHVGSNGLM